jgi:preprotein translocase subunit SecA
MIIYYVFWWTKIQNFTNSNDRWFPTGIQILTRSLDSAQERVEERAYQQRKNLFDYDDILNKQRNIIYYERRQILKSVSVQKNIFAYGEQIITDILLLKRKCIKSTNNFIIRESIWEKSSIKTY